MIDGSLPIRHDSMSARQRWTIFVASTGGALEVFDFVIYGFFAASIGRAFFPAQLGVPAATLSFAVLAIGYLSRLAGGVFLGQLGDKHGRRNVFMGSAMVAAVATLFIGVLPSYHSMGLAAPVLLILLRLTQGLCLGGELPAAAIYAVETAHARAGFLCGIVFCAVNVALLVATGINLVLQVVFAPEQLDIYGWRAGFLIGGLLGLFSFAVRRTLAETEEYASLLGARQREPLAVLFRRHRVAVVTGIAASSLVGASGGLFVGYMPVWLRQLHVDPRQIAGAQMLYVGTIAACIPVTAHLGDLWARRYVFGSGAVLSVLLAPLFYVAATRHLASLPLLFLIAGVVASFANGTFACAIAELFPVEVRFSGLATAMNFGLGGAMAMTPLAASLLASRTHWTFAPALFMVLCASFACIASFGMARGREAVGAF